MKTRQSSTREKGDESFVRAERLGRLFLSIMLSGAILVILVPSVFFAENSRIFLLKIIAIALLSLMPGWLYLQFLRNKGPSIYDEYVLNLFRLHIDEYRNLPAPPQHTSYYVDWKREHDDLKGETKVETKANLYRRKFESVYGKSSVSTLSLIKDRQTLRDRTETFSPVLMATLLLCLGWVLVLQPDVYQAVDLIGSGTPLSGRPLLPFEPLQFGFLGAYAFILQDLIHRYFRDDLKTGAYISAATRIVFVAVIVTTVDLLWTDTALQQAKIFAFFVGFFPQIGLQALQAAIAKPLRRLIPSLRNDNPLSQIEGLNIWYEARFAEEGIEDMQNLVSASLVDLMLRMRVPITRLVDWIDQAYLCLHLPRDPNAQGQPPPAKAGLRSLGIRTATDLERVWRALHADRGTRVRLGQAFGVSESEAPSVVRSVLKTFNGEPNLWHVREFTNHEWLLRDRVRMPKTDGLASVPSGEAKVVDLTKTPTTG